MNSTRITAFSDGKLSGLKIFRRPYDTIIGFIILAAITHLPFVPVNFFYDDFLLKAVLQGDPALVAAGVANVDVDRSLTDRLINTFHFFRSDIGTLSAQRAYGNVPWWSVTEGSMHPFRPLAAFTHWIDFNWWPDSRSLMQAHSFFYYLLFVIAGLALYRKLMPSWQLTFMAAGLLAFDASVGLNFNWLSARNSYLSTMFGLLSIYGYLQWQDHKQWRYWYCAVISFACALLSAEAGLATAGYLGAYALVYDRRGWLRGLVSLFPFFLIVLAWRFYYFAMGFGAENNGLYLDPGRDPIGMIDRVLSVFPLLVVSVATGVDGLISTVDLAYRSWLIGFCWVSVAIFIFAARGLLRTNREARFMFLGSVFAAIPHCSLLTGGSRSNAFIAIGFFYVFALWLMDLLREGNPRFMRFAGAALVVIHLVIPTVIQTGLTIRLIPIEFEESTDYPNGMYSSEASTTSIVYLNAAATNQLFYLPYRWSSDARALPKRIQALAPGLSSLYIMRKSEYELELFSPAGLVLHQNSPVLREDLQPAPAISGVHAARMVGGLLTSSADDYSQGRVFQGAGMQVRLSDAKHNRVTRVIITMDDDEALEHKQWMAYDWNTKQYRSIPPPEIGQTLYFPGPLDQAPTQSLF